MVEKKPPNLVMLLHVSKQNLTMIEISNLVHWRCPKWTFQRQGCGDPQNRSRRTVFQNASENKFAGSSHSGFLRPRALIKERRKLLLQLLQHNWVCLFGKKSHVVKVSLFFFFFPSFFPPLPSGRVVFWREKGSFLCVIAKSSQILGLDT